MTDAEIPVWLQALGVVGVLAFIIGIVTWMMREARKEFRLIRVFAVTFLAFLSSVPFVAGFWWFAPQSADRQNPWLLMAIFVPIFLLEAWGISLILRRRRRNQNDDTSCSYVGGR